MKSLCKLQCHGAWFSISNYPAIHLHHRYNLSRCPCQKTLNYSFHESLGYLTACPTNVGTGIRASCMLHLPSLVLDEAGKMKVRIQKLQSQLQKMIEGEDYEWAAGLRDEIRKLEEKQKSKVS